MRRCHSVTRKNFAHLLFRNIFTPDVLIEKLPNFMTALWFITLLSKNCCNDMDHEFRLKVAAKY
jgi:hypothetical protein